MDIPKRELDGPHETPPNASESSNPPPHRRRPSAITMPLATVCGLPASGKTTFAEGLVAFLQRELAIPPPGGGPQAGRAAARVVLVNEEGLRIGKREGYRGA